MAPDPDGPGRSRHCKATPGQCGQSIGRLGQLIGRLGELQTRAVGRLQGRRPAQKKSHLQWSCTACERVAAARLYGHASRRADDDPDNIRVLPGWAGDSAGSAARLLSIGARSQVLLAQGVGRPSTGSPPGGELECRIALQ